MPTDWRTNGVRVVRGDELDTNTPQTPGMTRAAAITAAVVVNLDLADVEPNPQQVHWVDDIHPAP